MELVRDRDVDLSRRCQHRYAVIIVRKDLTSSTRIHLPHKAYLSGATGGPNGRTESAKPETPDRLA